MVVLPILMVAPSASAACSTRLPLTRTPLVEPRSCTVIRGGAAEVLGLLDPDLDVLARDARVVDAQVGVVAAADHDAGGRQREVLAVELEGRGGAAYLRVGGVAGGQAGLETALLRTRKRPVVRSSLASSSMLTGPVKT